MKSYIETETDRVCEELSYIEPEFMEEVIKTSLKNVEQKTTEKIIEELESICDDLRKSNDLFRLNNDQIPDEIIERLKQKIKGKK